MRRAAFALLLLACSSESTNRVVMLPAETGDAGYQVDGSGGTSGGSSGSGGINSEGAPADTHPGGSSGDATPGDPCLEACRRECVAQTERAIILGCLPAENPSYCGCVMPGFTQCGWLPEPRLLSDICTDAG